MEVRFVASHEHAELLSLLGEYMRDSKPVSPSFAEQLQRFIEREGLEVLRPERRYDSSGRPAYFPVQRFCQLALRQHRRPLRQAVYEAPGRRTGTARGDRERCKARGVSYVEVQTNDEAVEFYFALSYESQPGMRVLSRSYTLSLSAFGFVGAYNS